MVGILLDTSQQRVEGFPPIVAACLRDSSVVDSAPCIDHDGYSHCYDLGFQRHCGGIWALSIELKRLCPVDIQVHAASLGATAYTHVFH